MRAIVSSDMTFNARQPMYQKTKIYSASFSQRYQETAGRIALKIETSAHNKKTASHLLTYLPYGGFVNIHNIKSPITNRSVPHRNAVVHSLNGADHCTKIIRDWNGIENKKRAKRNRSSFMSRWCISPQAQIPTSWRTGQIWEC